MLGWRISIDILEPPIGWLVHIDQDKFLVAQPSGRDQVAVHIMSHTSQGSLNGFNLGDVPQES